MADAVLVDTARALALGRWLHRGLDDPSSPGECDVVLPAAAYDLGLRTRRELRKQLAVDLPRSAVTVGGDACRSVDRVIREASNPRFCTQAVLAPPLEWLLEHGFLAHEAGGGAMKVAVAADGSVCVCKTLGLTTLASAPTSCGAVCISVQTCADSVVVGFSLVRGEAGL